MSDETASVDALSLLQADLSNQETTFPILKKGVVDFLIADMKIEPTKNGQGKMINIKYKLAQDWETTLGSVKKAGSHSFLDGLYVPGGPDVKADTIAMCKQKLAQLREAVFGDKTGAFGSPEQYIGKSVTCRVDVQPEKDGFPEKNRIAAWVKRT